VSFALRISPNVAGFSGSSSDSSSAPLPLALPLPVPSSPVSAVLRRCFLLGREGSVPSFPELLLYGSKAFACCRPGDLERVGDFEPDDVEPDAAANGDAFVGLAAAKGDAEEAYLLKAEPNTAVVVPALEGAARGAGDENPDVNGTLGTVCEPNVGLEVAPPNKLGPLALANGEALLAYAKNPD